MGLKKKRRRRRGEKDEGKTLIRMVTPVGFLSLSLCMCSMVPDLT